MGRVCRECGSPDVVSYTKGGRRYYRPFCSQHWSKYCYVVWKRARMREAMGLKERKSA